MALAKKCDICGKYHNHYGKKDDDPNGISFIHTNEKNTNYWKAGLGRLDCCTECLGSILDHINKLKKPKGPVKLGDLLGNTDDDLK